MVVGRRKILLFLLLLLLLRLLLRLLLDSSSNGMCLHQGASRCHCNAVIGLPREVVMGRTRGV